MGGGYSLFPLDWDRHLNTEEKPQTKAKIEKRATLPNHLFEAVDFRGMGIVKENTNSIPKFVVGEYYALQGIACDGFEMKEKIYQLISVVDDYKGTELNSLVVKQVAGEQGKIFTLSKNDCVCLNIEYEPGLQLFPKTLPWQLVKEDIQFTPSNLGTTPLSDIDNTIRYILLRLDGFKDYSDGYILTPNGKLIKESQFENTLKISTREPIVYGNGFIKKDGAKLNHLIAYPKGLLYNHGNFISSDDTIYVLIVLKENELQLLSMPNIEDKCTVDGYFGVERQYLDGVNPNEFITITWDELGAMTIKEYKEEKERRKRELEKQIEAEEKRKKKEAEAKMLENSKKMHDIDDTISHWYNIAKVKPKRINRVNINMHHNSIDSISRTVGIFDDVFKSWQSTINDIENELNKFDRFNRSLIR